MSIARVLLAVAAATVLLGVGVGTASARRLRVSSQTFRIAFARIRIESEVIPFNNCPITMEGSFHSESIVKVAAALVGYITRAQLGPCESGHVTILRETLPWHLRYTSFSGTLPSIGRVTLDIIEFAIFTRNTETGVSCLLRTTAANPLRLSLAREAGGAISEAELDGRRIPTSCVFETNNVIARLGAVTVPGSTTRVTLTLI